MLEAQLFDLLIKTEPGLSLGSIDSRTTLGAYFCDEGAWVDNLKLRGDAGEAPFLSDCERYIVIVDKYHVAEDVRNELLQPLVCLGLKTHKVYQASSFCTRWQRICGNFKYRLQLYHIESFKWINVYNTTFDFLVQLKELLSRIKTIDNRTEEFLSASDVNHSIYLWSRALNEVNQHATQTF